MVFEQISRNPEFAPIEGAVATSLINSIQIGILLFDESYRVVLSNHTALSIIAGHEWIWLSNKRLKTSSGDVSEIESRILAATRSPTKAASKNSMILSSCGENDHLLLNFSSLSTEDDHTLAVCSIVDPFLKSCLLYTSPSPRDS